VLCDGGVEEGSASDFAVVWSEGWVASGRGYVRGGITAEGVEQDVDGGLLVLVDVGGVL
jgi:hypothetical protein